MLAPWESDGLGMQPRIGEPESSSPAARAQLPGLRDAVGGLLAFNPPNIPDTSGPPPAPNVEAPVRWIYDFDPATGVSRAIFPGEVEFGGGASGVTTWNGRSGSVVMTAADLNSVGGPFMPASGSVPFAGAIQAPAAILNNPAGTPNTIAGQTGGSLRWQVNLGDGTAETPTAHGSNFAINGNDNPGASPGRNPALAIHLSSGQATVASALNVNGSLFANSFAFFTGTITVTMNASNNWPAINGTAAMNRSIVGQTGGLNRWQLALDNAAAESGSNVGSDFYLTKYNDAGAANGYVYFASRSTGVVTFSSAIVNGASDGRLKENVAPIVPEILQDYVMHDDDGTPLAGEPYYALDYPKLTALLIEAVKTLSARLDAVEGVGYADPSTGRVRRRAECSGAGAGAGGSGGRPRARVGRRRIAIRFGVPPPLKPDVEPFPFYVDRGLGLTKLKALSDRR